MISTKTPEIPLHPFLLPSNVHERRESLLTSLRRLPARWTVERNTNSTYLEKLLLLDS